MSSIAKKIGQNWSKNTKSKALGETAKKGLWTFLGGTLYWLYPTAIQGLLKVDMSGLKGVAVGVIGSSLTGILSDKKEIVAGGICAGGVHLTYNHLNGIITDVFQSPIFGYSAGAIQTYTDEGTEALENQPVSDGIPEGYTTDEMGELVPIDTPDGGNLLAQQSVNDFVDKLDHRNHPKPSALADYVSKVGAVSTNPMNNAFSPSHLAL